MQVPSTNWREDVAPDEAERFARYAESIAAIQQRKSARYGKGRALHRKPVLALRAEFEVLPDLPVFARQGLFATPGRHAASIRLSNGGTDVAADRRPDIRGFALKIHGVAGAGALDGVEVDSQDFLMINHAAFAFRKSDEFVALLQAAARGPLALITHFLAHYGLVEGFGRLRAMARTFGKPFAGFAAETFHTAAPLACGPYAMRLRLVPGQAAQASPGADWADELRARLAQDPLHYMLEAQFFHDEATTPIEDASVDWPEAVAPWLPVGKLTVPAQAFDTPEASAFATETEAARFDPWNALATHRPLGDVMRARKVAYYASQKGRGAA